jgi:hypothetical protein
MTTPDEVARFSSEQPLAEERGRVGTGNEAVDVLVLTALQEELEALLALEGGVDTWTQETDAKGYRLYRRTFSGERGAAFTVAAAWTGEMRDRPAALRAQQLSRPPSRAPRGCATVGPWARRRPSST